MYGYCRLLSICTFADVSFYHPMKYTFYSFQLLVTFTRIELLLIHALSIVPQDWVFHYILSPSSYTPRGRTAHTRNSLQCSKRYSGMLTIGLLPSRFNDSPLQVIGYISGSGVSYRASLLLQLWSWFLSPFHFSTIISLNRNNQQSPWIVYVVEYSPGYIQSLVWRVAWHNICGIW